jgi:hypothetical protein
MILLNSSPFPESDKFSANLKIIDVYKETSEIWKSGLK